MGSAYWQPILVPNPLFCLSATLRSGTRHDEHALTLYVSTVIPKVEILAQRKNGRTTWVALKDMKNSYSIHMSEYKVQRHIAGYPTFVWWIRHVLAKRNRIIGKLKSKYWVQMHMFGVKIPNSVQEEKAFDEGMTIPFGRTPFAKK